MMSKLISYSTPTFGDDATRDAAHDRIRQAEESMRVELMIAPCCGIVVRGDRPHERRTFTGGDPVPVDALLPGEVGMLVQKRVLLRASPERLQAIADAGKFRFTVAPGKALSVASATKHRSAGPGCGIAVEEVGGLQRALVLVAKGLLIDHEPPGPEAA